MIVEMTNITGATSRVAVRAGKTTLRAVGVRDEMKEL
jgi:hypothetical protein